MAEKKVTGITPAGIAGYTYLNKPDTKFKAEGEYKTTLTLGDEESAELRATIDKMTEEQGEKVKEELKERLAAAKTGAEKAKIKKAMESLTPNCPYSETVDDEGEPNGSFAFKFTTKASFKDKKTGAVIERKVKLFDAKRNPTTASVFSGSKLKVAYEIAPYFVQGSGAYGVSLRINAVQIIELSSGSGGGNAASYGFGEEEGYEDDGSASSAGASEGGDDSQEDDDF